MDNQKTLKIQIMGQVALAPEHQEALVLLYQPVFAYPALTLYFTLFELRKTAQNLDIQMLRRTIQVTDEMLTLQRRELEQFSLLRSYEQEDGLVLHLSQPLTPFEFLKHPSFGRLYDIVCGHQAFVAMQARYAPPLSLEVKQEISQSFDLKRLAQWDEASEKDYQKETRIVHPNHQFAVNEFLKTIPDYYFPQIMRTPQVIDVIADMGTLYKISFSDMRSRVYQSVNLETQIFDTKRFQQLIKKQQGTMKVADVENPYELDVISFLKYLQKNDDVIAADRRLLESLSKRFGLPSDVINVLIEYVWHTNKFDLNKSYIEKIAATWKRRSVETIAEALQEIAAPTPKKTKQPTVVQPTFTEYQEDVKSSPELDAEFFKLLEEDKQS